MEFHTKEDYDSFIGADILERYPNLYPYFTYVIYRIHGDMGRIEPIVRGYEGYLNWNESIWQSIRRCGYFVARNFLRLRVKRQTPGEGEGTLLSQTLVYNRRYDNVLGRFTKNRRTAAFLCGSHIFRPDHLNPTQFTQFGIEPIHAGDSLLGQRFYRLINAFGAIAGDCLQKDETLESRMPELELLLNKLETIRAKRHTRVKHLLVQNRINLYLTINQYYLSEILIIMACRELGIKTKQLAHHPSSVSLLPPKVSPYYAEDFCVWGKAEIEYHQTYRLLFSAFSPFGPPNTYATGDLEICYDDAMRLAEQFPMERIVTFMTSLYPWADEDRMEQEFAWRQQLFAKLHQLAEQQNVKIRIRYRPSLGGNEAKVREREAETVRRYGFEVAPLDPTTLMHDILISAAIVTTFCSVAWTAQILGRRTYRVLPAFFREVLALTPAPMGITDIELDDVPCIEVPAGAPVLKREDFLNLDRIFEGTKNENC